MKKIVAIILGMIMLLALASCGANGGGETKGTEPATAAPATDAATESAAETEPTEKVNLQEKVDAFLEKYMCVTHNKFDVIFNYTGSSFTYDNLMKIIKDAAELPESYSVDVDQADFDVLVENYQGAGDGGGGTGNGFYWADPVNVTFSNPATGEKVTAEISFSFRKCLPASEIYPDGVLGTCPEDGNSTMKAAYSKLKTVEISDEVPAYDGYEGEYTAEAVENFFRELTGLTDKDAYEFYAIGFDPEARGEAFYALFSD
ncbi:MAG: hypothetical protein IKG80_05850, partial [Clostridia bacterium]|nr:hypothetical protein [Clostridia bacterium]